MPQASLLQLIVWLFLTSPGTLSFAADAWPLSRGDAAGGGFSPTRLPDDLTVIWETKIDQAVETTPIVGTDSVFLTDVLGAVECLDRADGQSRWRVNFDTGFLASPTLLDSRLDSPAIYPRVGGPGDASIDEIPAMLIVGDVEGNVVAMRPADGQTIWKVTLDGQIDAAPSVFLQIDGDTARPRVLVTGEDGTLTCLDAADGATVWTYEAGDQLRCGASIGGSRTYLGGCDGGLHVVDLTTGQAIGEPLPLGGPSGSTPAIDGDSVFQPIMDSVVYRFDAGSTEPVWQYQDAERDQDYRASASIAPELIVVTSRNKTVDAIDRQTGERRWRQTLRKRADASPVIAGDDVWIATADGRLLRLALADGTIRWQYEIRGAFLAAPAIAGNQLIIADDNGVVRCFGS